MRFIYGLYQSTVIIKLHVLPNEPMFIGLYLQYLIQDSYILPVKNAPKASSTSLVNENRFLLGRIVYKYLERFFVQLIYINNFYIKGAE